MANFKHTGFENFAVFVLFFGLALVEALRNRNFLSAAMFLALGVLSFWADLKRKN
ncbi:MAG TPA: hypothetical protein VJI97_02295 [Candidatus Nanoarchaeia archaeon]|nr:hypothetical protein [Candidatus Nanoarchaeia archaeon]